MYALAHTTMLARIPCGSYWDAKAQLNELAVLAEEKGASFWKALGTLNYGCLLVLMGNSSEAITILVPALTAYGSTGATIWKPQMLSYLARAHADLGQFDDAWRCINEATTALETTKEKWFEAKLNRIAGEIATRPSQQDLVKAEAYFEQALVVARAQQARSWELRAAMSLARLWRDQGKVSEALELLAPVYGWFTEGFDTRDLKEPKALLDELAASATSSFPAPNTY
jgi:predicted ATPase